jgi:hypothetical protein
MQEKLSPILRAPFSRWVMCAGSVKRAASKNKTQSRINGLHRTTSVSLGERPVFGGTLGTQIMTIAPFSYHDPTSLPEALQLLEKLDDAKPLAGGQSLVPYLFFRMQRHRHLIDLNNIPELSYCSAEDGFLAYRRDDPAAHTA